MVTGLNEGRVVVITGAGRGIGRAYALEFARQGAAVVVNDLGGDRVGQGQDMGPAHSVAAEIVSLGGRAVANGSDASTLAGARELVDQAVDELGGLDTLVCNAGIIRDRSLVNMTEDEWDSVIRVHLKGTFAPAQSAMRYWRAQSKNGGRAQPARLITTTSSSGLFGNAGQANYSAAKAGIAGFTLSAAHEIVRYGGTANSVWPFARSRMTADLPTLRASSGTDKAPELDPAALAPFVAWLGSSHSQDVNARFFGLRDNLVVLAEGWRAGPSADADRRREAEEFNDVVPRLLRASRPNATFPMGEVPDGHPTNKNTHDRPTVAGSA